MTQNNEIKTILSAEDAEFVNSLKNAKTQLMALGVQAEKTSAKTKHVFGKNLGADFGQFTSMIGPRIGGAFLGIAGTITNAIAGAIKTGLMVGTAGAAAAVAAAGVTIAASIGKASEMEDMATQFEQLLGSAEAAKKRMEYLEGFAAKTPYELPELVQASKMLQTLTGDVLSQGDGLKMVGDAAAIAGRPISEVALHMGRMYDSIKNGRKFGESAMELTQMGVMSGELRNKLESMEGMDPGKVWATAVEGMSRFDGAMDKLSQTYNGLMSTMRDAWGANLREMGSPIIDALKPAITEATKFIESLKPRFKAAGDFIGQVLKDGMAAFKDGYFFDWLISSAQEAANAIADKAQQMTAELRTIMSAAFDNEVGEVWLQGLGQMAYGAGMMFGQGITAGAGEILKGLNDKAVNVATAGWRAVDNVTGGMIPGVRAGVEASDAYKRKVNEGIDSFTASDAGIKAFKEGADNIAAAAKQSASQVSDRYGVSIEGAKVRAQKQKDDQADAESRTIRETREKEIQTLGVAGAARAMYKPEPAVDPRAKGLFDDEIARMDAYRIKREQADLRKGRGGRADTASDAYDMEAPKRRKADGADVKRGERTQKQVDLGQVETTTDKLLSAVLQLNSTLLAQAV